MKISIILFVLMLFITTPNTVKSQYYRELFNFNKNNQADLYTGLDTIYSISRYAKLYLNPSGTIWQISDIHKTAFLSPPPMENPHEVDFINSRALVTDSLQPYPSNSNDAFIIKIPLRDEFSGIFNNELRNLGIIFYHQYESDSLEDGGIVEVSLDNGLTYHNAIDSFLQKPGPDIPIGGEKAVTNFYTPQNLLFNNETGFSGRSGGWTESSIWMNFDDAVPFSNDSLIFKFRFVSNENSSSKAGWLIDNIIIDTRYVDIIGIKGNKTDQTFQISPNPYNNGKIILSGITKPRKYSLWDLSGRKIDEGFCESDHSIALKPKHIHRGIYILHVTDYAGIEYSARLRVE